MRFIITTYLMVEYLEPETTNNTALMTAALFSLFTVYLLPIFGHMQLRMEEFHQMASASSKSAQNYNTVYFSALILFQDAHFKNA